MHLSRIFNTSLNLRGLALHQLLLCNQQLKRYHAVKLRVFKHKLMLSKKRNSFKRGEIGNKTRLVSVVSVLVGRFASAFIDYPFLLHLLLF